MFNRRLNEFIEKAGGLFSSYAAPAALELG
jgi:hypothetical protein